MKNLSPEQIEEYKQIDNRIIFLMGQANRYLTGYFVAFIGFWTWMASRSKPMEIISPSMVLSMILLLGIVLLDIHGRSICKVRAYKIVFYEEFSGKIHYESFKLQNLKSWTIDRLRTYGLLGLIMHIWGSVLILLDPTKSFVGSNTINNAYSIIFFIPGILYSGTVFFRKSKFNSYTQMWREVKKEKSSVKGTEA